VVRHGSVVTKVQYDGSLTPRPQRKMRYAPGAAYPPAWAQNSRHLGNLARTRIGTPRSDCCFVGLSSILLCLGGIQVAVCDNLQTECFSTFANSH